MPFQSHAQEIWMRINKPEMYKKWVAEHGHYQGALKKKFQEKLKK